MLLTLIGSKLGNTECTELVYSYPKNIHTLNLLLTILFKTI